MDDKPMSWLLKHYHHHYRKHKILRTKKKIPKSTKYGTIADALNVIGMLVLLLQEMRNTRHVTMEGDIKYS